MTLKLRVQWPNAGHALLPEAGADIRAEVGGSPLPFTSTSAGLREFNIPSEASRVVLKAKFTASFGAVGSVPPISFVVLDIEQPYDVIEGGTNLRPVDIPAYVNGHPLVDTKAMANVNGAVLVQLRTTFVDISGFWMAYASHLDEYLADHDPNTTDALVVMGHTGGLPLIWFACVPKACIAPPSPEISCLTFFRPENYSYTQVNQWHDMDGLNRYLLKSIPASPKDSKRDQFTEQPEYIWLRAGFEDALARSKKPAVLLCPWPNGVDYGAATGSNLPTIAEAAIRFLWSKQILAPNRGGIRLGRFGVSGYSAGGLAMWAAFRANKTRVSEVYAFDAVGTPANAGLAIQWFNSRSDNVLRMSGGVQLTANDGIRISIEKLAGGPVSRVTATPPDARAYNAGVNPLWDHVVSTFPSARTDKWYWHQFAIFGGFITSPGPSAYTFLQQFLETSQF